ncbi:hypothetical protein BKA56DRAFT_604424 [Ilyonectria sp. MPI-CAGE-AT-0026]|nr:hypothetical protein BKA56DRAFT_604424 [Ilyonectria sp. MPI-CAGE-AT-0026]
MRHKELRIFNTLRNSKELVPSQRITELKGPLLTISISSTGLEAPDAFYLCHTNPWCSSESGHQRERYLDAAFQRCSRVRAAALLAL